MIFTSTEWLLYILAWVLWFRVQQLTQEREATRWSHAMDERFWEKQQNDYRKLVIDNIRFNEWIHRYKKELAEKELELRDLRGRQMKVKRSKIKK